MTVIAGIGFRDAATPDAVLDALARAGADGVRLLALPLAKAKHPLVQVLADRGYRLTFVEAAILRATPTPTQSAAALAAHGTGSVAEACALAAAGAEAHLVAPRSISGDRMATAALAITTLAGEI